MDCAEKNRLKDERRDAAVAFVYQEAITRVSPVADFARNDARKAELALRMRDSRLMFADHVVKHRCHWSFTGEI